MKLPFFYHYQVFSVPNPHRARDGLPRLLLPFPRYAWREEFWHSRGGVEPPVQMSENHKRRWERAKFALLHGGDEKFFREFDLPEPSLFRTLEEQRELASKIQWGYGGYLWPGEMDRPTYDRLLRRWLTESVAVGEADEFIPVGFLLAGVEEGDFAAFRRSPVFNFNGSALCSDGDGRSTFTRAYDCYQHDYRGCFRTHFGAPHVAMWADGAGWYRLWGGQIPAILSDGGMLDYLNKLFPLSPPEALRRAAWEVMLNTLNTFFKNQWAGVFDRFDGHLEPLSFLLSLGQGGDSWRWSRRLNFNSRLPSEWCNPGPFTVRPLHRPVRLEDIPWRRFRTGREFLHWCLTPGPAQLGLLTTPSNLLHLFGLDDLPGAPNPLPGLLLEAVVTAPSPLARLQSWHLWQDLAGLELEFPELEGLRLRLLIRPPLYYELAWLRAFFLPLLHWEGTVNFHNPAFPFRPPTRFTGPAHMYRLLLAWLHLVQYLVVRVALGASARLSGEQLRDPDRLLDLAAAWPSPDSPHHKLFGHLHQPIFEPLWRLLLSTVDQVLAQLERLGGPGR